MTLYPGRGKHWWERITAEQMIRCFRRTEELGYDSVQVPTHFVMNHESAVEMGTRWVHSLSAAGVLLGATTRIHVAPLLVVPYHNPIELAKALSTLSYMSDGRVVFFGMVGYKDWEYELLRVPFAERGAIMDEYLEAMVELWTSDAPAYHGRFVEFDDVVFDPKPVRPITMWFGGRTKAALRRVARFGDGWMNSHVPRAQLPAMVDWIRSQPSFEARPRPLEISSPLFEGVRDPDTHEVIEQAKVVVDQDAVLEQVEQLAALGVTKTDPSEVLGLGKYQNDLPGAPPPVRDLEEYLDRLAWFAEDVMPEARRIVPAAVAV
jgi:alkanesulfonate monooxygenase SsuD/methylene tetrahydromethanopterin reductase-like flavin-dependent oxidoreductase (luciferase family)